MRRRGFLLTLSFVSLLAAKKRKPARAMTFSATAHSVEGETAAGTVSRPGTAAADPAVLPLGTRIRVLGAGKYSGVYTIEDTGAKVKGREIDIYMRTGAEAKQFGKRPVRVIVLKTPDTKPAP
jgi:3D (Asp-Asp-Asp) domain-containing protein